MFHARRVAKPAKNAEKQLFKHTGISCGLPCFSGTPNHGSPTDKGAYSTSAYCMTCASTRSGTPFSTGKVLPQFVHLNSVPLEMISKGFRHSGAGHTRVFKNSFSMLFVF
jgi:hypothetical protein